MPRRVLSVLAVLWLACLTACEVGTVGPADDDPGPDAGRTIDAPQASYSVTVEPSGAATTLGTSVDLTVTVTSSHFDGAIALSASGAPSSWTVDVTPASLTLTDGATATATVHVTIPSDGAAAPSGQRLTVEALGSAGSSTAAATVTVADQYVVSIAPGTGSGAHWGPIAGGLVRLHAGTTLRFVNDDSTAHRIHTGGGITGFPHEASDMGPGQAYEVTVGDGSDLFYCHDHGQGTGQVNLTVQ